MAYIEKPLTFPSGGFELSAHIHIAPTRTRYTAFMLHGFTDNKIEVNRLFIDIARALCRNGVAVFRFDYRGHGESPLDFEEFRFEYAVEDPENALKYVRETYRPEKLFLIGLSMAFNSIYRIPSRHTWRATTSQPSWIHFQFHLSDSSGGQDAGDQGDARELSIPFIGFKH
ncbi:MAG: alpha/beta hydrolase [Ignisphaera sp.]